MVKDEEGLEAKELAKALGCKEIVELISLQQYLDTFFLIQDKFIQEHFSPEVFKIPEIIGHQEEIDNDN